METKKEKEVLIFALMAWGKGISGGDKISIELARRFAKQYPVTLYLWEEGLRMYKKQNLKERYINYQVINMSPWKNFGFWINYIARIFAGVVIAFRLNLNNGKTTIIYCATEFWMDSLPGFILKMRFPKITLISTWFQTAPNPVIGFKEGERILSYRFHALYYWLVQIPIKPLIRKYSDLVLVNNEDERKEFKEMDKRKKVMVVLGAVDLTLIRALSSRLKKGKKIYDGVFQGRFHPQKGVVELISIWRYVVEKRKNAKLALIGDGPLMADVKQKIRELKLEKNIKFFGYVFDGIKKYQIFNSSKIVLHPAFYDSGGMASAEAMAMGLPAVGFSLPAYKSYYPKGMIKVPINDLKSFADEILNLLENKKRYTQLANEAKKMIYQNWSWDQRFSQILSFLK